MPAVRVPWPQAERSAFAVSKCRTEGVGSEGSSAARVADLEGLGSGRAPGHSRGVLHPRAARLPHLHGAAAGARARGRRAGRASLHRRGHLQGSTGVPAQRPDGVRIGVRPRGLPGPRLHGRLPTQGLESGQAVLRRTGVGLGRAPDDRGLPHEPVRRGVGHAHADQAAGGRIPGAGGPLQPFLRRPGHEARPAPRCDHRPHRLEAAHVLLCVDRLGGRHQPPGTQLLVHEQLAAGAPRGQQADRERDRLVGAVADRTARWHRSSVRGVRALGPEARLAGPRAGVVVVPPAGRGGADAGAAGHGLVLLRDGRPVPDSDLRGGGIAALPDGDRQLLRLRPRASLPLQPDAHLARPVGAPLGLHLVHRGGHLPGPDDRQARAEASGQARLRAAGGAGRRGGRHAGRVLPRRARRARRTLPRTGSGSRASSTWTWPGSGRSCSRSACSCGCSCSTASCACG